MSKASKFAKGQIKDQPEFHDKDGWLVAYVTKTGRLGFFNDNATNMAPTEALEFAAWIKETFE